MTDHRVDIRAYAREVEADMRAMLGMARCEDHEQPDFDTEQAMGLGWDPEASTQDSVYDIVDSYALEVVWGTHRNGWDSDPSATSTELLLTFGGPTVQVTLDRYGSAELYHSWGREPCSDPARPKTTGHLPSEAEASDRQTWPLDSELVLEFVSTFFPHPEEV